MTLKDVLSVEITFVFNRVQRKCDTSV